MYCKAYTLRCNGSSRKNKECRKKIKRSKIRRSKRLGLEFELGCWKSCNWGFSWKINRWEKSIVFLTDFCLPLNKPLYLTFKEFLYLFPFLYNSGLIYRIFSPTEEICFYIFSEFLNLVHVIFLYMTRFLLFILSISLKAIFKAVGIGYKVDFFIY